MLANVALFGQIQTKSTNFYLKV